MQTDFFAPDVNLNPARKQRINEYIKSIPEDEKVDEFDAGENQKISALLNQFDDVKIDQDEIKIETKKQEKPNLQTRVRNLKAPQEEVDHKKYLENHLYLKYLRPLLYLVPFQQHHQKYFCLKDLNQAQDSLGDRHF